GRSALRGDPAKSKNLGIWVSVAADGVSQRQGCRIHTDGTDGKGHRNQSVTGGAPGDADIARISSRGQPGRVCRNGDSGGSSAGDAGQAVKLKPRIAWGRH